MNTVKPQVDLLATKTTTLSPSIENKLQTLVSDTEKHVRRWLFGACGESLTKQTLDAIVHQGRSRAELAAQWPGPDWLFSGRSRKILKELLESDKPRARMLATDQLQTEMEESVSLRLGSGVIADEMLLINATFLSLYESPQAEEEDSEQRSRDSKPLTTREHLIIQIVERLRKDGQKEFPATEAVCKEIDQLRKHEPHTAAALTPSHRWFAKRDADQPPLPEARRTWLLAYGGPHRTAVVNAIRRAWYKRSQLDPMPK
ncbi:MAG TPA: hypothetical protein VHA33_11830 [Candidatus Angelobacter sp.]|nr:hypothetical protein [Candidatus Angelobacter sp.]